jgi:hypothetical protein
MYLLSDNVALATDFCRHLIPLMLSFEASCGPVNNTLHVLGREATIIKSRLETILNSKILTRTILFDFNLVKSCTPCLSIS